MIVRNFRDGFFPYQGAEIKEFFEELKKEVLFMKEWRNVDNITLAGGEPLISSIGTVILDE